MNEAKNNNFHNDVNEEAYRENLDLDARIDMIYATGVDPWSNMTLNEYQKQAEKTKSFPERHAIIYPALGLSEEAGEVAGKIKKWLRGDTEILNIDGVKKEMGDVLWYLASLATDLGITLEDVALTNIKKLQDRKKTGTIKGDGDNREQYYPTSVQPEII